MATPEHHKYIIAGAGPAGLQMGYFLGENARDYVILEKSASVGSFFRTYPRHRRMISLNKKYNFFDEEEFNWRHDWNSLLSDDKELRFTRYSDDLWPEADVYCQYLEDFAKRSSLRIRFNTEIVRLSRPDGRLFRLTTASGAEFTCEVLLMGLGTIEPMIPGEIEGIELATGYEDMTLDLDAYRNKRVGIIGQGNSAFETADYVAGVAAFVNILAKDPIRFAWNSHYVGHLRAINNNIFDMYQLKALHAVLNPRLVKIERAPGGTLVTTHEYDYPTSVVPGTLRLTREYDFLIRCCGWRWIKKDLFAPEIMPQTWGKGKYPEMTPRWESVNVRDLYFIGGAMGGNDRKAASAFIHGYRYNIRTLSRMLEERYEGISYPMTTMGSFSWNDIADYVYNRVSLSAALFQLFGFLCDVIVVAADNQVSLLQEVPVAQVAEMDFGGAHVFTVTLEFGFHQYSESAITFLGPSDPNAPQCAAFLHPVIRYRRLGAAPEEFHFGDSLLVRWDRPHGTGGAVMSYHRDFERWVCGKVGIPVAGAAPGNASEGPGPFRPWTAEEKEAWHTMAALSQDEEPGCRNALETLPAGESGR